MKKTVIYYGSTTGTCQELAERIARKTGISEVKSASELDKSAAGYDVLLLGTSTWGAGDLQDDWYDAIEKLKGLNLKGKTVAIFGCGDSVGFSDTFCGAMRALYDAAVSAGAEVVGQVDASGYTFDASDAVIDGKFVGLALDEGNDGEPKTNGRIDSWAEGIREYL